MRTTVDIDDALMRMLTDRARKSGQSLKKTLNEVVARGLGKTTSQIPIKLPSWKMGRPLHPIDRAWDIDAELELDEIRGELEKGD